MFKLSYIYAITTSVYFTANTNVFNEAKLEELEETNPRSSKDEKVYQKQLKGKAFTEDVIAALKEHESDKVYMDFSKFSAALKKILNDIDGMTASRLNSIAMELSVMDKTAVVQKDRKGNVLIDPTTKDSEIIRLNQDADEYMKAEVLPHIPDAIYFYDYDEKKKPSATNKEKLGAEFPFTRYFYEYHEPEKANDLFTEFMNLETEITSEINDLQQAEEERK